MTVTCVSDFPFCCVQVGSRIPYLNFYILQIRSFRGAVVLVVLEGTSDIYWQTLVIFCHFGNFGHFWHFYMHNSFNGKSRQVKSNPASNKSSETLPCMVNSTMMHAVGLCSKRKRGRVRGKSCGGNCRGQRMPALQECTQVEADGEDPCSNGL